MNNERRTKIEGCRSLLEEIKETLDYLEQAVA